MRKMFVNSMACALAIGSMTAAHHLAAQQTETPVVKTATSEVTSQPEAMKVCEEAFNASQAMHAARVAIFNGDPKLCEQMLTKAHDALELASKDEAVAKVKADLVPINGSLTLADTFVPSEQKAPYLAKANEHFQKGESARGIEQLKLGEIEVNFSRVLMPIEATRQRLAEAISLANEHKFYEANLSLKAVEEGLEFDSISLFEFPKTATATTSG